jgi:hypothetical protein
MTRTIARCLSIVSCFMSLTALAGPVLAALPSSAQDAPETQCRQIASADFSGIPDAPTQVSAADLVKEKSDVAAYCKVEGYVHPQVGFELRLPLTNWNGKFIEVGCGGWCGSINTIACNAPIRRGYACIATDMGHKGSGVDVLWAEHNLQALIDFGYRATHVGALAGKAIAARFYSKPPNRSYFMGCSTGGYQGITSAQKFPWDFDGVVAGAPDIDGAAASLRGAWILRTLLDEYGKPRLTKEDLQIVHDAALARCDKDDGIHDGIIGNPSACHLNARDLVCRAGQTQRCLTSSKFDAVAKLYAGPMNSKGEKISTGGFLPGSELAWLEFWPADSLEQFYRYGIPGYSTREQWKYTDFDFDHDPQRMGLAAYYDNSNPDLRKFKQGGAKLIVYHGATDTIDLPGAMTDYYETVEKTMGGRKATQDFFRLFLIPGMNHCTGGKGAFTVDWLSILEAWVEKGRAPNVVTSVHVRDDYLASAPLPDLPTPLPSNTTPEERAGIVAYFLQHPLSSQIPISFRRPVYPYPSYAQYKGKGDVNLEKNFTPVTP